MQLYFALDNIHIPSARVIIALNYIRGERVDSWAVSKTTWLCTVSNDPSLLQGQDSWSAFKEDFFREFVYPTERAKAQKEIEEIKMEGIELDAYIQKFCQLARNAQYDLNAPFTIHLFLQGLPADLVLCCFDRDKLATFEDWVHATRKYHRKYRLLRIILNLPPLSNEEELVLRQAEETAARDYITMDVNTRQRVLTEEDKIRYKREGRCFHCSQHRHISRMCPHKGETTTRRPVTNEGGETQGPLRKAEMILLHLRALSIEGRIACVEMIRDDPTEFWNCHQMSSPTSSPLRTGVIVLGNE